MSLTKDLYLELLDAQRENEEYDAFLEMQEGAQ